MEYRDDAEVLSKPFAFSAGAELLDWPDYGLGRTRELADLCVNHYYAVPGSPEPTWTLNGATLQQLWSQKACKCQ